MQDCVTHTFKKSKRKQRLNAVIFAVVFFFLIFLIFSILIISKRSNILFEPRTFFVVAVFKNKDKSLLAETQSEVKSLGGAGVFVKKDNHYYLAAGIYLNKFDAKSVCDGMIGIYAESEVIELHCKGISRSFQNQIKQNDVAFELLKFLNNHLESLQQDVFDFAKGETSEGKFMSKIIADKIELEKLISRQNNDELKLLKDYSKVVAELFDTFVNKFYVSDKQNSLCYEFMTNFYLTYFELCENLQ